MNTLRWANTPGGLPWPRPPRRGGLDSGEGGAGLTEKSVVPAVIRQEPLVHGAHQEVVRQARGLGPHQQEARGDVDGLVGDGDEAQVLPRLAEA